MQAYDRHFGFREPPFSVTPDPRFFYATPTYREAYSTLRYGMEARKGFVLVTGEVGTGKTTLLRMLMQHAEPDLRTAFVFNPPNHFSELLKVIINELELPDLSNDRAEMTAQLNEYLLDQLRQGHIVSVLVDEAQRLNRAMLEELRLLSNLETHRAKLIQIVLMGQPELEQKLDQPELRQLKQRLALRCRLTPLAAEDVPEYIAFRLAVAGDEKPGLFDHGAIKKIALYSQGIPRLINVLCDNALLRACEQAAYKVSAEMIDKAARDLRLDQPQLWRTYPADSEALRNIAGGVAEATKRPDDTGVGWGHWVAQLRNAIDSASFTVRVWIFIAIVAAIGAVLYMERKGLLLMPIVTDVNEPLARPPDNSGQLQEIIVPEPHLAPKTADIARVRVPVSETPEAFAEDYNQESRTSDAVRGDAHDLARAAGNEPATEKPTDDIKPQDSERNSARVVVRLAPQAALTASARKNERESSGIFNVVGASFVRATPSADAEITATLQPGTRVRVLSRVGEYFHVRAIDGQSVSGYVHREDAFFEPSR